MVSRLVLLVLALAVTSLVLAEARDDRGLQFVSKPIASTCFVVLAVHLGAMQTQYGHSVLVALILGFIGDACLLGSSPLLFVVGLGSFLVGHAAFGVAFIVRGVDPRFAATSAVALIIPMRALWRWLRGSVPANLRGPVLAYLVVITAMVALAIGTATLRGSWPLAVGAVCFAASDVSVARDRFKHGDVVNKAWGLPLYYLAQCLLASTVAGGP